MKHITKNKVGFTLIEIMVAIGIVAILAAVVMVSMNAFRIKGRSAKALAQLSSAIPSMISCWGNGGEVYIPNKASGVSVTSDVNICSLGSSYGVWPRTESDLNNYKYEAGNEKSSCTEPSDTLCVDKAGWYITLSNTTDKVRICCNSTMKSCKFQYNDGTNWDSNCTATVPVN